jgi:hypothetical protein
MKQEIAMDALPNAVRQELVMNDSQIDGHAVTTYRFSSTESPEAIRDRLAQHFQAAGKRIIETTRGDWQIISTRSHNGVTDTVQVRATPRGSEGLATHWRRAPQPDSRSSDAANDAHFAATVLRWLPQSSRILRQLDHQDPGRRAGTLVALVDDEPGVAASHLKQRAQAEGFRVDPSIGMPAQGAAWYRGGAHASGEAIALSRERDEVIATVSRHRDATAVVLHWSRPQ